jgi:hypothetical protein
MTVVETQRLRSTTAMIISPSWRKDAFDSDQAIIIPIRMEDTTNYIVHESIRSLHKPYPRYNNNIILNAP